MAPERDDLWGLAFDPVAQFTAARPAGILYGGAPSPVPDTGGKGEPGQSALGYIFAPSEENPPVVLEESVLRVSASGAGLHARIDPKGFVTRYAFQYLSEAAYKEAGESFAAASESPLGGGALGASVGAQGVTATVGALAPDTTYIYRVLATSNCAPAEPSKVCEDAGPAKALHTYPAGAPGLPDNRAWELVSPAQKNGGQVLPAEPLITSCGECKPGALYTRFPMQSDPGGEAVVYEGTPFSHTEGARIENSYLSRRDPESGWRTAILSPPLLQNSNIQGYRAFDRGLGQGVIEQSDPPLTATAPPNYDNLYTQPTAAPGSLTALLSAPAPHRPPTGSGAFELHYGGASEDGQRVFFAANDALAVDESASPPAEDGGAAKNNLYEWRPATGQLRLLNVRPGNAEAPAGASFGPAGAHAISADGSRAFWSDAGGQVYVREDAQTTEAIPDPGKFLAAARDGSRVLLQDGVLYDLQSKTSTDLSAGKGGFLGILGQSEDLSHVYFLDTAVLSGAEANSEGEVAGAGQLNLYAWQGGTTRFVARLVGQDNTSELSSDWVLSPAARTAQASPGGGWLAFLSLAPLTGYDNTGPCETDHAGGYLPGPCPEVFLYQAASGKLRCPSCNKSGAAPLGWSVLRRTRESYLSEDGRLFFDSQDSLSPFDTNEGVEDVYQYEPEGVGSCAHGEGCVALISAGAGAVDSNFLAADRSGANVFFTSRDRLVAKDKDEMIDLYDARIGGGIAAETETQRSECQGEACQPAPAPPDPPNLGSTALRGAGNLHPPARHRRCPKGKRRVRRHGRARCVKRKRAHRKHRRHRRAHRNRGGSR